MAAHVDSCQRMVHPKGEMRSGVRVLRVEREAVFKIFESLTLNRGVGTVAVLHNPNIEIFASSNVVGPSHIEEHI